MLKPYVCAVCEKVIIDENGTASLIGLFSKIAFSPPKGTEIPKDAVAAKEWAVFSSWDTEPGDELREYLICVQLLYPDKSQFGEIIKNKVNVQPNRKAQVKAMVTGFPVGQQGPYIVRVWIEEANKAVVQPIEIFLDVELQPPEQKPTS